MSLAKCKNCGGDVVDGPQKYRHLKQCKEYKQEGIDHVVCRECGYKSPNIVVHIKLHGLTSESYRAKFPDAPFFIESTVTKRGDSLKGKLVKPLEEKTQTAICDKCGQRYDCRKHTNHLVECISDNPSKYIEGHDYVKCPICSLPMSHLTLHLKKVHGWTKEQIRKALHEGLKLRSESSNERQSQTILEKYGVVHHFQNKDIQEKRRQTWQKNHGCDNPFASPAVQEQIRATNLERYGHEHPMQSETIFIKQQKSAQEGPSAVEVFFDEHTSTNVVYTGYGARFIHCKTGVNKYSRLVKNLCPDFMIFGDAVLPEVLELRKKGLKFDSKKHKSKYVIEILGDYYHSEEVIGVPKEQHMLEIMAAYKSVGIECVVLWENDVLKNWDHTRHLMQAWLDKAIQVMNQCPLPKERTKPKVDSRKAHLPCPYGSGLVFRSQEKLDRWVQSPSNPYRPDAVENLDYVKCHMCNKRFKKLSTHLKREHKVRKDEYQQLYPLAPVIAVRERERIAEENKAKPKLGHYVKRTSYRGPDGAIIGKADAWRRAWNMENPPVESIIRI